MVDEGRQDRIWSGGLWMRAHVLPRPMKRRWYLPGSIVSAVAAHTGALYGYRTLQTPWTDAASSTSFPPFWLLCVHMRAVCCTFTCISHSPVAMVNSLWPTETAWVCVCVTLYVYNFFLSTNVCHRLHVEQCVWVRVLRRPFVSCPCAFCTKRVNPCFIVCTRPLKASITCGRRGGMTQSL